MASWTDKEKAAAKEAIKLLHETASALEREDERSANTHLKEALETLKPLGWRWENIVWGQ